MVHLRRLSSFFLLGLITLLLSACGQSDTKNQSDVKSEESALNLSGVWRQKSDGSLITIQHKNNKIDFIVDNSAKEITLGEVDEKNSNVTVYVKTGDNSKSVWTIRKVRDKAKEEDFLRIITHAGDELELNFVRNLTSDDIAKINTVIANQKSGATLADNNQQPATPAANQAVPAPAAPANSGYHETIVRYSAYVLTQSGSNALMRQQPGRGGKVVQTLRDQEEILVVGQTNVCEVIENHNDCWFKVVSSKGKTGYLFGAYINAD